MQSTAAQAVAAAKSSQAELDELQAHVSRAQKQLSSLQSRQAESQAQCDNAQADASAAKAHLGSLQAQRSEAERAVQRQEAEVQRLQADCAGLTQQQQALRLQVKAHESETARASRQLEVVQQELAGVSTKARYSRCSCMECCFSCAPSPVSVWIGACCDILCADHRLVLQMHRLPC